MNSKELLDQADDRACKLKKLSQEITKVEDAIEAAQTGIILILHAGEYTSLQNVFDDERMADTRGIIKANLIGFRNCKAEELEKLLGIKNQSGYDVEPHVVGPALMPTRDPVEQKLTEIIKKEEQKIKKKPKATNVDIDKFANELLGEQGEKKPAKEVPGNKLPRAMTVEEVTRLYRNENKTARQIAEHFDIKTTAVSNFIFQHDIGRRRYDTKPAKKPEQKQPEETERP